MTAIAFELVRFADRLVPFIGLARLLHSHSDDEELFDKKLSQIYRKVQEPQPLLTFGIVPVDTFERLLDAIRLALA